MILCALGVFAAPGVRAQGQEPPPVEVDGGVDGSPETGSQVEGPDQPEVLTGVDVPQGSDATAGDDDEFGRVLVLATQTDAAGASDAATFDVLLATALQEIGFQVVETRTVLDKLHDGVPGLGRARELYLDLKLEEALQLATEVRDTHRARHGHLVAGEGIAAAELFMVQVLLDLGRVNEALEIAVDILVRHPQLRLDPVEYSPAMQALWLAAVERSAARQPEDPGDEELSRLGATVGVDWVAAAVRKVNPDGEVWLVIRLVPSGGAEEPSRHPVELGPRGWWARNVRLALQERFPPPEPDLPPPPPVAPPGNGEQDKVKKTLWYKSWWFWTVVGVVVVGGTAGGISGYYSSQDSTPRVEADLW